MAGVSPQGEAVKPMGIAKLEPALPGAQIVFESGFEIATVAHIDARSNPRGVEPLFRPSRLWVALPRNLTPLIRVFTRTWAFVSSCGSASAGLRARRASSARTATPRAASELATNHSA